MTDKYKNFLKLNFYQIYPRSFMDSDNNGWGDLKGVIEKVPYLADLGIKGVWFSPFYPSTFVDGGYDIADYCDIDPRIGTLEDFKEMLGKMHESGIKVIIDLVVNHTSVYHKWFQESKKSKDNPYHDYYYWFDEPQNTWGAGFGGSAWEYCEDCGQYYLHSFAVEQADLNWHNPVVREEIRKVVDFWVDLGVDGFRCDVLDCISKDLTQNIFWNGPKFHEYVHELFGREKTKDLYVIGECWTTTADNLYDLSADERGELTTSFVDGNIRSVTNRFDFIENLDYDTIHRHFTQFENLTQEKDLIFAPYFENHDQSRSVSRFVRDDRYRYEAATFFATLLYTSRGTPFILQGQEFGTPDAKYDSIECFDDPATLNFYAVHKDELSHEELFSRMNGDSRDNGRRPMLWDCSTNGGFNKGAEPWLPLHSDYKTYNLENDLKSDKSVFRFYKKMLALRNNSDALTLGKFEDMTGDRTDAFIYSRTGEDGKYVIVCNYKNESIIDIPDNYELVISNYADRSGDCFRPFEAAVYKMK